MTAFLIVVAVLAVPIAYLEIDAFLERRDERQGKGRYDG